MLTLDPRTVLATIEDCRCSVGFDGPALAKPFCELLLRSARCYYDLRSTEVSYSSGWTNSIFLVAALRKDCTLAQHQIAAQCGK
jgi:hypothetical protein